MDLASLEGAKIRVARAWLLTFLLLFVTLTSVLARFVTFWTIISNGPSQFLTPMLHLLTWTALAYIFCYFLVALTEVTTLLY
jgi:hypothetical protein